jgi:RNA polymerase sigma-70 factor (ECF subfamily)
LRRFLRCLVVRYANFDRRQRNPDAPRRLYVVPDAGNPDWEAVYRENVGWVYRLMFGKVGNRPDAEDLTTEVFLAALRPLRTTADTAEVRAYLRATARTVLADHWRERLGRPVTTIDDDPAAADLPEAGPDVRAEARAQDVLRQLPENYRRILELRFLQGMTVKEAAAAMEVSVSNAKVLQHRALRQAARLAQPQ